jgi:hypothetical protein
VYVNNGSAGDDNRPVLYSDNGNKPLNRLTSNEGTVDSEVSKNKPKGWRTAPFKIKDRIPSGNNIWFGVCSSYWEARFDYGQLIFIDEFDYHYPVEVPDVYPQEYVDWYAAHPEEVQHYYNFKVSWYCSYTAAQNYTRTLTQGVTLADSRKPTGNYKRSMTQTVRGTTITKRFEGLYQNMVENVKNTMALKRSPTFIRKLIHQAGAGDKGQRVLSMLRKPEQTAGAGSGTQRITQAKRAIADTGKPGTATGRKQDFKRGIAHGGNAGAAALRSAEYVKRFQERAGSTIRIGPVRNLALNLIEAVAGLYGMKTVSGFGRSITDSAGIGSGVGGMVTFLRTLFGLARGGGSTGSFITCMRVIQETETLKDETGHSADYLRGLFEEAGNIAGTTHRGAYYRVQQETAGNEALPLRHLFIFLRLLTAAYIRDYMIGRFLKSKEEVVIKSPVCREIELESKIG